jgi:hypothetical protein
MFHIVKHMFHILNPSLSPYLFSFYSWFLKQSCRVWDEEPFIFLEHVLILPLTCSNPSFGGLFSYETWVFHLSVAWRQQASNAPPPPCRSPIGHHRSPALSHAAARLHAGKQELDALKVPATPPSF